MGTERREADRERERGNWWTADSGGGWQVVTVK